MHTLRANYAIMIVVFKQHDANINMHSNFIESRKSIAVSSSIFIRYGWIIVVFEYPLCVSGIMIMKAITLKRDERPASLEKD